MLMQGGTDDSQVHCPHPAHHEKELTANPYQPKDQKAIYRPERGLQAVRSGGVDGSRVMVDKENPRTEIFIEEMEDEADANLRTLP